MATFRDIWNIIIDADTKGVKQGVHEAGDAVEGTFKGRINQALQGFGLNAQQSGALIGTAVTAGAAAAGAAIGHFVRTSVEEFQKQAQEVLHFRDVSGLAADEASRFVAVADDFGVAGSDLATAIGKMDLAAGSTEKLQKLGIEIGKNKDGAFDAKETFLNVVDAFNATDDASRKAAIGSEVFGKGWQSMSLLLEQGSGKIQQAFADVNDEQLFSDNDLAKAEEFRLQMDEFNDAIKGVERELGQALVPALGWALGKVQEFASGVGEASDSVGGLSLGIAGLGGLALAHPFIAAGVAVVALANYLEDATNNNSRLREEFVGTTQAVHDQALAIQNLKDKTANTATVFILQEAAKTAAIEATKKEWLDAVSVYGQNNQGLRDALDAQREAAEKATQALKDYRTATNDLRNDQLGLEGAIYSARDAIDTYSEKVGDSTATLRDQQKANLDVKLSLEGVMQRALDAAASQAALHGATLTTNGAIGAQYAALKLLYEDGMLPELRKLVDEYALALYNIPGEIHTNVDTTGLEWLIGRGREGNTGITGSASAGAAIVSNISAYESSNGTAWRSGPQ